MPEARSGYIGIIVAITSLSLAMVLQFGGMIWWGATITADVRYGNQALKRMEDERYTKADAMRDMQRVDQSISSVLGQVIELRDRVNQGEQRTRRDK